MSNIETDRLRERGSSSMERLIQIGLEMIRGSDYDKAIAHFRDSAISIPTFDVSVERWSVSMISSYERLTEALLLSNMSSKFLFRGRERPLMRVVEIEDVSLLQGFYDNDSPEAARHIQQQVNHNTALNYVEVWLLGLYYLQHGAWDMDSEDYTRSEAFIGAYLREHGVPLDPIWSSRHPYAVRV